MKIEKYRLGFEHATSLLFIQQFNNHISHVTRGGYFADTIIIPGNNTSFRLIQI